MIDTSPRHIVAACALVTNAHDEILLVKTNRRGWDMPGGQVELGESLPEAVIRETHEEAGVTISIRQLVAIHSNLTRHIVIFSFIGDYISGDLTPSNETPDVRWVPRDEALPMITHPAVHVRLEDIFSFAGSVVYRAYELEPYRDVSHQAL